MCSKYMNTTTMDQLIATLLLHFQLAPLDICQFSIGKKVILHRYVSLQTRHHAEYNANLCKGSSSNNHSPSLNDFAFQVE